MTSVNPTGTLAWLRAKSDAEPYLTSDAGTSLFLSETFKPYKKYAWREVTIPPLVGTQATSAVLNGEETITFPIPRHGDLLSRLSLQFKLRFSAALWSQLYNLPVSAWTTAPDSYVLLNDPSSSITVVNKEIISSLHPLAPWMKVKQADLIIGNKVVQTVYGDAMAYTEYARKGAMPLPIPNKYTSTADMIVNLPFFFGKQLSDALPLGKLTEHDVEVRIRFAPGFKLHSMVSSIEDATPSVDSLELRGQYVYLSDSERSSLLVAPQYQRIMEDWSIHREPLSQALTQRISLPFRGPASSLLVQFNFPSGSTPTPGAFKSLTVLVNNAAIIGPQAPDFYQEYAAYKHHAYAPPIGPDSDAYYVHFDQDGDAMVPDGHIDLSAFDKVELLFEFAPDVDSIGSPILNGKCALPAGTYITVFARGWNVFALSDGMGQKVFVR